MQLARLSAPARIAALFSLLLGTGAAWAQPAGEAPFTANARWHWYVRRTFGWERMGMLVGDTAIDHCFGNPAQWDRRPASFAVRYSAAFGHRLAANTIELGAGLALHEDTRLKPSGRSRFSSRLFFAAAGSVAAGDGRGHRRFSYSRLIANLGGNALASTWYPAARTPESLALGLADSYLGQLQNSLLVEFGPDLRRFGKKVERRLRNRFTHPPTGN